MECRGGIDEIFCFRPGYLALIVTTRGDVFLGTIKEVDIVEETVTLEDGTAWLYEVAGYVARGLDEKTLSNDEILTCLSNDPIWPIVAG